MAKKKQAKPEIKSAFLRKALSENPNLDYEQANRRWAQTGHAGQISNALYYQVRSQLGIKTQWAWVKEPSPKVRKPKDQGDVQLYTLEVFLLGGPVAEKFAKKNPEISRTIQIRGNQTLEDLHQVVFDAFDRWDEHMYEFQFGKGPMDPKGSRYVLPSTFEIDQGEANPPAGRVDQTRIDSLGLKVGQSFGYWFDFGDDWWHQIDVKAIEEKVPAGKLPKITNRVGQSPPQYLEEDE